MSRPSSAPVIELRGVDLIYRVFTTSESSLRGSVLKALVGGRLGKDASGHVVVQALNNLNITIYEGERVALYGHNGSGKTTALRVAAGVYEPTRGQVLTRGNVSAMLDLNVGLSPDASGRSNIMLLGLHRGLSRKQITALIPDIEEFSELGMFFDMPVRTYSSGMLTRLGFAFATAVDPDILILDEWITPGDAAFMNRAADRMSSHAGNARALLLASHSVEIIKRVCTRVIVLERGVIVEDGPPLEVFDRLDSKK